MIGKVYCLTPKALESPAYKATAGQLAETGRLITRLVYKGEKACLKQNDSADAFFKFANKDGGGNIMKKCLFAKDYKFTQKGRQWLEYQLYLLGLKKDATLQEYMSATIRKIKKSLS